MKKYLFPILLLFTTAGFSYGQSLLTIEDAVKLVLRNNYDILVSRAAADISKTNNSAGNAGMLPSVGVRAGDNFSVYNVSTEPSTGGTTNYPNFQTNTFSAAAELDWTLFDGGKMFITRKKLSEMNMLGEIGFRDKVSQTVFNTVLAYYDVVRQKQQLESVEEGIRNNRERVKILQASFNAGLVPKTDLLQAQVDLNVYLENAILQETIIQSARRTLNQLLSRDSETPFEVVDSIDLTYHPDKNALTAKLFSQNTQFLSSMKQLDIAKLSTKELVAQRYPWLSLVADYNFLQSTSTQGTILMNRSYGPLVGGTLTLPVWYGHKITREVKVAKLEQQSASYDVENTRILVNTQLQNALSDFEHTLQLLSLEKDNTTLARENLTISMQRLRLGQTTSLEVRQAEESYIQSLTRLIQFKYSAKASETKLRQLVAEL